MLDTINSIIWENRWAEVEVAFFASRKLTRVPCNYFDNIENICDKLERLESPKIIRTNSFWNFILKAEQLGIVIAGGNGEEDQSNQFNSPEDLSFDGENNLIKRHSNILFTLNFI